MIITKTKIKSCDKYLSQIKENEFYIYVELNEKNIECLKKYGITCTPFGKAVVPEGKGPTTNYNTNGKFVVKKDSPKEWRTFERDYHTYDWHHNEHYGTYYFTKLCYARERVLPPLEVLIIEEKMVHSKLINKNEPERFKLLVNMFLEIFGYCEVVTEDFKPLDKQTKLRVVPWTILPKGKYPWDKIKEDLKKYFAETPTKSKKVIQNRQKAILKHKPTFVAIGFDSFNGYVVYGFEDKDLYVFESNMSDNATYVFKGSWEKASALTKREIIQGELCHKRIVHTPNWELSIDALLG